LLIGDSASRPAADLKVAGGIAEETIVVLEANLDDVSPQVLGYAMERLLGEGALDVFYTPIQMKKSRPAMLLTVLANTANAERLSNILFSETTTLGLRVREEKRLALARRWERVTTPWGEARVKIAEVNEASVNSAPEYEDCRRIAELHQIPLKTVMQEVQRLYLEKQNG